MRSHHTVHAKHSWRQPPLQFPTSDAREEGNHPCLRRKSAHPQHNRARACTTTHLVSLTRPPVQTNECTASRPTTRSTPTAFSRKQLGTHPSRRTNTLPALTCSVEATAEQHTVPSQDSYPLEEKSDDLRSHTAKRNNPSARGVHPHPIHIRPARGDFGCQPHPRTRHSSVPRAPLCAREKRPPEVYHTATPCRTGSGRRPPVKMYSVNLLRTAAKHSMSTRCPLKQGPSPQDQSNR